MRTTLRTMAATLIAALATSLLVTLGAGSASAATYSTGFHAPDTVTYAGSTCTKVAAGEWRIVSTWKTTGGRYANFNNAQRMVWDDDNRYGGVRVVRFAKKVAGMGGTAGQAPTSVVATYSHIIAPIAYRYDTSKWRTRTINRTVPVSCPA